MGVTSANLWIISGPSAVGKGTVCARLRSLHHEPFYSVSCTTRPPRLGEIPGESYHFVSDEEFDELVAAGDLLEWAVVHGKHRYGTPRGPVVEAIAKGRHVILEIDLQGARQVKARMPEAQLVFLMPPSWEELVNRLVGRGTEDAEARERRLATAKLELASIDEADHIIVNESLGDTVESLVGLLGL